MTKPKDFIMSSDYATLKNDNSGRLSVTLPSSLNIPAATVQTYTDTVTMGVAGGALRARINSSKGDGWHAYPVVVYSSSTGGSLPSFPGIDIAYDIFVNVHRTSPTQVRLTVAIPNGWGETLSITGLSQTITAHVATFLPPTP